jgi:hypothetical protein
MCDLLMSLPRRGSKRHARELAAERVTTAIRH